MAVKRYQAPGHGLLGSGGGGHGTPVSISEVAPFTILVPKAKNISLSPSIGFLVINSNSNESWWEYFLSSAFAGGGSSSSQ